MYAPQEGTIKYNDEDVVSHHGVAAVIKDINGDVLMQEHVKYGFWTISVGKVKENESVMDGLKQEILEECNLYVEEAKELIIRDYFYERNGNNVKVVSHLFDIRRYRGEMKNLKPTKHKQQIFMPIEKIIQLPYLSDLTLLYLNQIGVDRLAKI